MIVKTPTSNESMTKAFRASEVCSVLFAVPLAAMLRDPGLFSGASSVPLCVFCAISYAAGLLVLWIFHLGRSASDHVSSREAKSIFFASFAITALTAGVSFSFDRLNLIPRSLPLIQLLVLNALILGGRVIAVRKYDPQGVKFKNLSNESQHILLVGANKIAVSYLAILDAFGADSTNIVGILDNDKNLIGKSLFGQPVIAPVAALPQVVSEYRVHGVEIDRILIMANSSGADAVKFKYAETYCHNSNISVEFIGDVLGIEVAETQFDAVVDQATPFRRSYSLAKRAFDFSISLAIAIALAPAISLVVLGMLIDMGRPILFWQKRVGFRGSPFLIYKFRTLRAPFDRSGNFVADEQRVSAFGNFLRHTRLDELPQLWNVLSGDMSFVGPRPLLPVDQPTTSKRRLSVRPGLTGWAQINGGRRITADEKGVLDDWYVENATFLLDLRIILRTIRIVLSGDKPGASRKISAAPTDEEFAVEGSGVARDHAP